MAEILLKGTYKSQAYLPASFFGVQFDGFLCMLNIRMFHTEYKRVRQFTLPAETVHHIWLPAETVVLGKELPVETVRVI